MSDEKRFAILMTTALFAALFLWSISYYGCAGHGGDKAPKARLEERQR